MRSCLQEVDMSDNSNESQDLSRQQSIIDSLARETETPADVVRSIYVVEHSKLERVARIKTFVPVLASRRVKRLLSDARDADDASGIH
jgi:hypothetical protein